VDDNLLQAMATDLRNWGAVAVDEALEIGLMSAAVTEAPVSKRAAGAASAASGTDPGLKQFQTVRLRDEFKGGDR